jgi:alanyl-tRNA synthetase
MGDMVYTERLYYQDAYLQRFTAQVIARAEREGRAAVALDRTAFYPTGGGQPNDAGDLGGRRVLDVAGGDGLIWHVLEGDAPEGEVAGAVDWGRRFDHMQQHTGQHILSQAFVRACNAETVAFHLGVDYSTIDLNRAGLGPGDIARAEAEACDVVDRALPVLASFVDDAELAALPLRKPPKTTDRIRVVQVAGYDWSACGGTHVANTAEIGLIKITGTERRGPELRVTFLCGRRARADYARLHALAGGLAARFSVGQDDLPAALDRLLAEQRALRKDVGDLEAVWAEVTARTLWESAEAVGKWRLVAQALDGSLERVKPVAQALRAQPGAVVLLATRGDRPQLMFARADDVALDAGALLRAAVAGVNGKGGGRPDWAQGGAPDVNAVEAAVAAARQAVIAAAG